MYFEFTVNDSFDFLTSFAEKFAVDIENDELKIPVGFGQGSIKRINLEHRFKLIIHQYKLNEDFILKRLGSETPNDMLTIIFNNNDSPVSLLSNGNNEIEFSRNNASAIQIASSDLDSLTRFPANTEIYFAVINIEKSALNSLLNILEPGGIAQHVLSKNSGFLYYESMTLDIQKTLKELTVYEQLSKLKNLFYRIKAAELVFLLFDKLLQRETIRHSQINQADIDQLFAIRTSILEDLSVNPQLPILSEQSGMSETKMKSLFKQVFGDSIYNYYQKARMEQAAFLLKQRKLSVSQTGYQLGFSNLSHFSRLFEKYHGIKPKRYTHVG